MIFRVVLLWNGGRYLGQFWGMSLCVDLCTPSETVGGVSFAAGLILCCCCCDVGCLGPCNFVIWLCRSFVLCEARYRSYLILRGVAMCQLVLVA